MKIREQLLIGALLVTLIYAAWARGTANRLRSELTALQASHQQLRENHRQMRERYIAFASNPGTGDEAFRKLIAVLEADGSADIITPSDPGTTRINKASGLQIR